MKKETRYMLMAMGGNAIFGLSFLFSRIAMESADPMVLLAIRFLTAFLLMSLLIVTGIVRVSFKNKQLAPLLFMGIMQPVLYFVFESYGIKWTSSSFAGIMISLIPIAGLLLAFLILKERPTLHQVIFSLVSVGGVIILSTTGEMGIFSLKGLLCLIGAVFAGSLFNIQSKKLANTFSAFERTYVMFALGALVFTLSALISTKANPESWLRPLTTPSFWLSILYLSCVSSIGAFMLLNKALDVLPASKSLVFANVTSVISVLAGVLILHESINMLQVVGITLALIGVYEVNRVPQK